MKILEKLGVLQKTKYYGYVLKLALLQRKNRTTSEIINEYQQSYSKNIDFKRLDDILFLEYDKFIETEQIGFVYDEHFLLGDHRDFLYNKEKEFQDWFKQFKTNSVLELGCGIGRHLFMLRNNNFLGNLSGIDISKNGIKHAKEINEKFNTNIDFKVGDFTKEIPQSDTIITYGSMEQNPHNLKKIINEIIRSKPKQVIHAEDFFEIYKPSLRKFFAKLYCNSRDYQTQLYKILRDFERKDKIKILNLDKAKYNSPVSCHGFCRWEPRH